MPRPVRSPARFSPTPRHTRTLHAKIVRHQQFAGLAYPSPFHSHPWKARRGTASKGHRCKSYHVTPPMRLCATTELIRRHEPRTRLLTVTSQIVGSTSTNKNRRPSRQRILSCPQTNQPSREKNDKDEREFSSSRASARRPCPYAKATSPRPCHPHAACAP